MKSYARSIKETFEAIHGKQYKAIGWVVMNKHGRRWWPCGSVCSTQTIARNSYELNEGVSFNRGFAAGHTKCVQIFVEVK